MSGLEPRLRFGFSPYDPVILFTDNSFYCILSSTGREKLQKRVRSKEYMKKFLKSHKKSFLLQTEICSKNLALANVNYPISDT